MCNCNFVVKTVIDLNQVSTRIPDIKKAILYSSSIPTHQNPPPMGGEYGSGKKEEKKGRKKWMIFMREEDFNEHQQNKI